MKKTKDKNNYEEAFEGFKRQGLYLDEEEKSFNWKEKSKCHCAKHPEENLMYSWKNVKIGRFSCPKCRKENKRSIQTEEEKIEEIKTHGLEYVRGDLSRIVNPVEIKCKNGHIFKRSLNNIKRGIDTCPICNNNAPKEYWTFDNCEKWINENAHGYKLIDIKNDKDKGLFIKIHCGNPRS